MSYAEKTMASLLQLHTELMEEKERRVELYRRLMEKDEALAELRYQVKILEDRLRRAEGTPQPAQVDPAPVVAPAPQVPPPAEVPVATGMEASPAPVPAVRTSSVLAPSQVKVNRPAREGWRQW